MSGRSALLQAIREQPRDEALRLVYADWLEEHGDTDDLELARFIRFQCRIEPRRDAYDPDWNQRIHEEYETLQQHREAWLGPFAGLDEWKDRCRFYFRRGLVERVAMPLPLFLEHARELVERFPALCELVLFDVHDRAAELAGCPHLRAFHELTLGDRLTEGDGMALLRSPHLQDLPTLHLWLVGDIDRPTRHLAALPRLEAVHLHQLHGGLAAGELADARDGHADDLAEQIDRRARSPLAQIHRPWARLFPLAADVGWDLHGGHSFGNRQTLVIVGSTQQLLYFDEDGRLLSSEEGVLAGSASESWRDSSKAEILEDLRRRYGFEPATIHVREFSTDRLRITFWPFSRRKELKEPSPEQGLDGWVIQSWLDAESFVIDMDDDAWAGMDGRIHST